MAFINYISGIIRILELPRQELLENSISVTKFRSQLPLSKTTNIIDVTFWGNLALDIASYYKIGDYIVVEGYISLRNSEVISSSQVALKKIELTALKIYPLYSNINNSKSIIDYTSDS